MNYFWGGVTALILTTIILIVTGTALTAPNQVETLDLETQCVYDDKETNTITLNQANLFSYNFAQDNTITFEGQFPIQSPRADLDYTYNQGTDKITLNVQSSNEQPPAEDYYGDCDGITHYQIRTPVLDEGRYEVEVRHNDRLQEKQTIRVK